MGSLCFFMHVRNFNLGSCGGKLLKCPTIHGIPALQLSRLAALLLWYQSTPDQQSKVHCHSHP